MPTLRVVAKILHSATIAVDAASEVAFDVVAGDVMKVDDDPGKMGGHRPLTEGPLREGFRWQQRVVHNRKLCHTWWSVTEAARPKVLEQTMVHFCADAQRESQGGERWEFHERGTGSTVVELHSWRTIRGLAGWIAKLLHEGERSETLALKRRLAYVQFEAERRSRGGVSQASDPLSR
jgi:hypothetical protein